MADTLPSPPASPPLSCTSSSASSKDPLSTESQDALVTRLDDLLIQYLELLDQYTTLRTELSKSLSAGFFSLAQSQRASTLGPARRYGEECYDDRMKAQRILRIEKDTSSSRGLVYRIEERISKVKKDAEATIPTDHAQTSDTSAPECKPVPTKRPDSESCLVVTIEDLDKQVSGVSERKKQQETPRQDPSTRDPITWFGVLVPPALRQTQKHFIHAVDSQIPDLVNVQAELKSLEKQIWLIRRDLGMLDQYQLEDEDDAALEDVGVDYGPRKEPVVESKLSTKSVRQRLPTRSVHSKSTLLQLGD